MRWLREFRAKVHSILQAHLTPRGIGLAVAVGVSIGVLPIYGLHLGVCVLFARWLRLNQAVVYAAANISNPLFAPFLVAAEVWIGGYLRLGEPPRLAVDPAHETLWQMLEHAPDLAWDCTLGSLVLGATLAPVLGGLAWAVVTWRSRQAVEP